MYCFYLKNKEGRFALIHTSAQAILLQQAGWSLCSAQEYHAAVYPYSRALALFEPPIEDGDTQRVQAVQP